MENILGLYPLWYVPNFGSGMLVAIIASTHVLFSHISVGASLLLAYLVTLAYRYNRPQLYDYVRKYVFTLLLTSYIIGSLTGPGIWFSTTVSNPRGISELIHNFVWVWAAEWVWFVTEVVLVYVMYYIFDKVGRRTYMYLSWVFALASVGTLLLIVGILSFMMSPGRASWFNNGNLLFAFYNPNYFPHVLVRLGFMVALGALVGLAVAYYIKEKELRLWLVRRLGLLGLGGALFSALMFPLYMATLPDRAHLSLAVVLPPSLKNLIFWGYGLLFSVLVLALVFPRLRLHPGLVGGLAFLVLGLAIFPQERVREAMRKPFIAGDYLYANQLVARDVPGKGIKSELGKVEKVGLLALHPFVPASLKSVTSENALEAGRAMALLSCSSCHSLEEKGPRPLVLKMQGMTEAAAVETFLRARLSGDPAHGGAPYMPKLVGNEAEIKALSLYLADLNRRFAEKKANLQVNK